MQKKSEENNVLVKSIAKGETSDTHNVVMNNMQTENISNENPSNEDDEAVMAEELKSLQDYVQECSEKLELKEQLLKSNTNVAATRPDESFFSKKDSTVKKNTAFIKKLKSFTESQRDPIMKEVEALNLTKYTSEAATAIVEAKLKMSDIPFMLQLCSILHQRYAEFAPCLMDSWKRVLIINKDEKMVQPSKLRVDLRFFADLITVGILTEPEALRHLANQLQFLTANDKEENHNLGTLTNFCRHCGDDWAGILPRQIRLLSEKHGVAIPRSTFLPPERLTKCRQMFKDYYAAVLKHLGQIYKELKAMDKANRRLLHTKGELSTDRKDRFDQLSAVHAKLKQSATIFADLLDEDPPQLPCAENTENVAGDTVDMFQSDKEFEYDGDTALFEDEDTRLFYEDLTDLKQMLPGIVYKDSEHASADKKDGKVNEPPVDDDVDVETLEKEMEQEEQKELSKTQKEVDKVTADDTVSNPGEDAPVLPPEEPDDDINASMKLVLDAFLNTLPHCVNRDLIEKAAINFCMQLNTKANRRRLIRTLYSVHRTRYDLLPFYSRLIATLRPVMPDVGQEVCSLLISECKWHINKKDQINIESKLKTVRYIGELVKFSVMNGSDALNCLRQLIFHFHHHNIEMACALLDTCGRFLYRSKTTHHRTKVYLDVMMRRKVALHMDQRYVTMIENAYYYCNPPLFAGKIHREPDLPPIQEYLRRLLYKDLNKNTLEKILRMVRKFDWKDKEFVEFAVRSFTCVWNVRYNNIHCLASLLAGLLPYHLSVVTATVDSVLEDIRVGMEINLPKFNQRRQSVIKYLGELYSYRMVDSLVVFKTLYSLITFGVFYEDGYVSPLDPPDHLFRINLVCTLLETCGSFFSRGNSSKRLDFFLTYFQRYYWFKKSHVMWKGGTGIAPPIPPSTTEGTDAPAVEVSTKTKVDNRPVFPIRIDHLIVDTLQPLRPKLKLAGSWQDSLDNVRKVEDIYKSRVQRVTDRLKLHFEDSATGDGLSSIAEDAHETGAIEELSQSMSQVSFDEEDSEDEQSCQNRTDQSGVDSDHEVGSDTDVQGSNITSKPRFIECPEDKEIASLLDNMMTESFQSRSNEPVKPVQAINLPSYIKTTSNVTNTIPPGEGSSVGNRSNGALLHRINHPEDESLETSGHDDNPTPTKDTVPFTLMTRRGNKAAFTPLHVPLNVDFATRFLEDEAAEREEKARMKRLVLNMHEQQLEQEEHDLVTQFQEGLFRQVPSNVNRERRVRYQHPKGAPDADAIFGSSQRR